MTEIQNDVGFDGMENKMEMERLKLYNINVVVTDESCKFLSTQY